MRALILLKNRFDTVPPVADLYRRAVASDFVRKVAETFATRVVLIGLGVVTGVLIARILGPEGRGIFAVAGTISAIGVQFGNLGLHSANTYAVARDRTLLGTLLANSLAVSFVIGGLSGVLFWLALGQRPDLFPLSPILLALVLVSIPLNLAYLLSQNLLLGIQEVRAFNKIELVSRIITVGLITMVLVIGIVTPTSVFVAGVIAGIVNLGWVLVRLRPFLTDAPRPSWSVLRNNLGYGVKAYLACLFGFLVIRLDLLMVQTLRGAEQTGYYSIAVSMADLLYLLPTAVGTILFPKLAAMETRREKWRLTVRTAAVVLVLMVLLSAVAAAVARPAVGILFGAEFLPAVPPFVVLAAGMIFLGVSTVVSNYLAALGLPRYVVWVWAVVMVLNVVMNLWWIPSHGIMGAAVASLISYVLATGALVAYAAAGRRGGPRGTEISSTNPSSS